MTTAIPSEGISTYPAVANPGTEIGQVYYAVDDTLRALRRLGIQMDENRARGWIRREYDHLQRNLPEGFAVDRFYLEPPSNVSIDALIGVLGAVMQSRGGSGPLGADASWLTPEPKGVEDWGARAILREVRSGKVLYFAGIPLAQQLDRLHSAQQRFVEATDGALAIEATGHRGILFCAISDALKEVRSRFEVRSQFPCSMDTVRIPLQGRVGHITGLRNGELSLNALFGEKEAGIAISAKATP